MTMSAKHRDLPIREIEARVALPIFLRHFRLYSKGKQPVAFLTWGSVSDEVRARLDAGDPLMSEGDWRSGKHVVIIDVISSFNSPKIFIEHFLEHINLSKKDAKL